MAKNNKNNVPVEPTTAAQQAAQMADLIKRLEDASPYEVLRFQIPTGGKLYDEHEPGTPTAKQSKDTVIGKRRTVANVILGLRTVGGGRYVCKSNVSMIKFTDEDREAEFSCSLPSSNKGSHWESVIDGDDEMSKASIKHFKEVTLQAAFAAWAEQEPSIRVLVNAKEADVPLVGTGRRTFTLGLK